MNKSENNARHRLIRIYQMLMRDSDMRNPMIITDILPKLEQEYGIETCRDSVREDLKAMCDCGLPIEKKLASQYQFYYEGVFETAELKLLIDAVSSSKFITDKESSRLIEKILSTTSRQEAESLTRHIYADGRVKTDNESGYYIVDAVNEAIETSRKISFQYTDYDGDRNRVLRHDGQIYVFSPWVLVWDGDYYYMLGWSDDHEKTTTFSDARSAERAGREEKSADAVSPMRSLGDAAASGSECECPSHQGGIRTFRLDRIAAQPQILEEAAVPTPEDFDINKYRKSAFRMFGADETVDVTLLCDNSVMRGVIDHFGTDAPTEVVDENHFRLTIPICPTPTFYRWLFGWGWDGSIVIEAPDEVVRQYKKMLRKALRKQTLQ